ncbi:MAG: crossover junction endodeoxyribonuclease RuvC [Flavobacteriales bacterium]|nr:crossover junction endodeoxyribonuclease RuvC [Flavobacteriales bacterium]
MKKEKIILGIDPGTSIMGFGLVRMKGSNFEMEMMDVLILNKIKDPYLKLQKIFQRTLAIIDHYHPDEVSLEAPFYGKNVQSMLKLGRAQGVAMAAALQREIPVTEYAPLKIKKAVTGLGSASKQQVASMLMQILNMKEMPKYLDATDGLAAAVCHGLQNGNSVIKRNGNSWASFIQENKGRVSG